MTILAALLVCLAVKATFSTNLECRNSAVCPCGSKRIYVRVCIPENETPVNVCARLLKCETCEEGSNTCSKCPEGLRGPFCSKNENIVYCENPGPMLKGRVWSYPPDVNRDDIIPSNLDYEQDEYPAQTILLYSCNEGYRLEGSRLLTCQSTGHWSAEIPSCVLVAPPGKAVCRDPGLVPNSVRWNTDGSVSLFFGKHGEGQSVVYICNSKEYVLQGTALLTCTANGTWSSSLPKCIRPAIAAPEVTCSDPGQVENADRFNTDGSLSLVSKQYRIGQSLVYSCHPGFDLQHRTLVTCLSSGAWSYRTPHCIRTTSPIPQIVTTTAPEIRCPDPGQVVNAERLHSDGSPSIGTQEFRVGQSLVYTCHSGFALQRRSLITCLASGSWSFHTPSCARVTPRPVVITTTTTNPTPVTHCKFPGEIANGRVVHIPLVNRRRQPSAREEETEEYAIGSRVQYSCKNGYVLKGSGTIACQATGKWSAKPPTCSNDTHCENPGPIPNGNVMYYPPAPGQRNGVGSSLDYDVQELPEYGILIYSCDDGYRLEGVRRLVCESRGFWSEPVPACVPDCGRSFMKLNPRITNGSRTISGEWPWMVSISVENGNRSTFLCAGAVLNSHTVLTAAHCLVGGRNLTLRFGKHHLQNRNDDTEVIVLKTREILIHPDYSNKTLDSDIGLIKLARRIRFSVRVQPICLPDVETTLKNLMVGRIGYLSSWGVTELALPAEQMKLASLPVISNEMCQDFYRPLNLSITSNMFCAGYEDGRQRASEGDSGAPFVFYDRQTERYTLEGVVSFGVRTQDTGKYSVTGKYTAFTKVFRFMTWILINSE